jgi:hypothetical protein
MDGPRQVTADEAAAYVRMISGRACQPGTIRVWATRRRIGRHGQDGRHTLYDLREIHRHVTGHDPYDASLADHLAEV